MKILMMILAVAASTAFAQSNVYRRVKVTGDRVSLRAQPGLEGELLDRAMRGEEMPYIDHTNGWYAVQAPSNLNFWVFGNYVDNGKVLPKKLNVRSGPSQNYNVVTIVLRDELVDVRGEFNGWLKIAPPKGTRVWISSDYSEILQPARPETAAAPEEEPQPEPVVEEELKEEAGADQSASEAPAFLMSLDKSRKQGVNDEYPGIIRRANPGLYKLVLKTDTFEETICLIRGEINQMEKFLNYPVLLKGRIYWVKGVDVPVMIPTHIIPNPILSE
ncbi:SH3 domain-containing protein [Pontiella agarivorans]|uniref:SH3 domain-containing protein n=1 Tax=Pontiella agarivorans TaxID=3038953 RepID=A0ABU5MXZ4_9BACT|nr:SH3 domain-containing protein [Pontiella agarivorans]MDZ8119045.1 SH3 domain-containing protein [Pontiella agarivorans]